MMKTITIIAVAVLSAACAGTALPPLSADHPASPAAPQAAEPGPTVALGRPVRLPAAPDSAVGHAHHGAHAQHMGETPGSDPGAGADGTTEPGQMPMPHEHGSDMGDMHAKHHAGKAAGDDTAKPMAHEHGASMDDMHAKHHGEMTAPDDAAKPMPHEHGAGMDDMHAKHHQAMPEPTEMRGEHDHGGTAAGNGHAGHAHPEHGAHWMAPPEAAARINPVPATPESIARGARIFATNCVTCHGASGEGDGPLAKGLDPQPANLAAMATEHSDGDFAWKVAHGRGAMPAWQDILSEQDIWHTVNYIKSLGSGVAPQQGESRPESAQHQHGSDGHQH